MIMFAATGALQVIIEQELSKMTESERCQVENDSARLALVCSVARRFDRITHVRTALKELRRLILALSRTPLHSQL
jgi:hypothetical protein